MKHSTAPRAQQSMVERTNEPKLYEPFPPGEVPKGWPREYVSAAAYRRLLTLYRKAKAELRELDGGGGPLFDGDLHG